MEDKPLSPEDRTKYVRQRQAIERNLPAARLWKRTVIVLTEDTLDHLKAKLFTPETDLPDLQEIRYMTDMLSRLRRLDGEPLVIEYRDWQTSHPALTEMLVRIAQKRERAERAALLAYFEATETEASAA